MKKKILTIVLGIALFIPTIKASNDNPKVVSEIVKDGSLDFTVALSDMNLETTKEYEWAIVENQAATPEDTAWTTVNNWTNNTMDIYLDYSTDKIFNVLSKVDTAYLVVRENESKSVISNHIKVDVSVPYAYGAVPYEREGGTYGAGNEIDLPNLFRIGALEQNDNAITSIKITDNNIIQKYLDLKKANNVTAASIAELITSLNLTSEDIPKNFEYTFRYHDDTDKTAKNFGITENALYFLWGSESYNGSKKIYGVTIYDNGYEESSNQNTTKTETKVEDKIITKNDTKTNVKQTSNTTENPKTGIHTSTFISLIVIIIATTTYIIIRKKNKFNNI